MHHNVNQVAWQIYNLRSAVLLQDQPRHKACRSSYSLCLGDIVITYLISSIAPPLHCLAFPLAVIFAMVREELGAVLLSVPQVVFLSGRQVIGCSRVEGGHAPSHADADESIAYRRFGSHVCKYRTYFFNTLDAPPPGACRGSRTGSVPRSSSAASCTPNPPTSR